MGFFLRMLRRGQNGSAKSFTLLYFLKEEEEEEDGVSLKKPNCQKTYLIQEGYTVYRPYSLPVYLSGHIFSGFWVFWSFLFVFMTL